MNPLRIVSHGLLGLCLSLGALSAPVQAGARSFQATAMPMLRQVARAIVAPDMIKARGIVAPDMVKTREIVAPDMVKTRGIVAPDMVKTRRIVAPDMVRAIVAPDMIRTGIVGPDMTPRTGIVGPAMAPKAGIVGPAMAPISAPARRGLPEGFRRPARRSDLSPYPATE